ncbi:alkaline phosphatase-like protein [Anaeromyces robustus]|uniref:Alkaline phosphatase-like protein n=1 Tax=Anaeromyces robustus TaxID=1754192 RepID=A0A1Y1XFQ9_9FUNG|nr:alkaline phosphatase-like protein [Anaeromyces robustus]|eukprot:ORX84585.1 alkaline phosphatase-like protein [Anaeromyces robustus]
MGDVEYSPTSPSITPSNCSFSQQNYRPNSNGNIVMSPIKHVLIICINGFSIPTDKTITSLKTINKLMKTGTYTKSCRSIYPTEALPNLASFLFSADPVFTGINSDKYDPYHSGIISSEGIGSHYPNLFSVIRCNLKNSFLLDESTLCQDSFDNLNSKSYSADTKSLSSNWKCGVFMSYGMSNNPVTGVVTTSNNGDNFEKLMIPNEYLDIVSKGKDDKETIESVKSFIRNEEITDSEKHSVIFVSLENSNREGCHSGFSKKYWEQLEMTDELIGQLIEEYNDIWSSTLCVIMSDHGRSMDGKDYGKLSMEELITPLIFNGPGIEEGHQLYTSPISIIDIAPTIIYSLCMSSPIQWRGRVIKEVFDEEDGWMYTEELGKNQDIIKKFRILTPKKSYQKVVKYSLSFILIITFFIVEVLILLLWFFMKSERENVHNEL